MKIVVCLFFFLVCLSAAVKLCGDKECLAIISTGKTTCNYNAGNKDMVSFRGNTICRVMSKSVGENSDLWEIEVQGRRGYAPKNMIMEQKILIKAADLIEVNDEPNATNEGISSENITDSQIILGSEINLHPNDAKENDNEQVLTEPIARKIFAYKTGVEENQNFNNVATLNSMNNTIDIQTSPEKKNEGQLSRKFTSAASTETTKPAYENTKITKMKNILTTFANQKISTIDEFAGTEEQKHFGTTSDLSEKTSYSFEKVPSITKASNKIEFTTNIPLLSEGISENEELGNKKILKETNQNAFISAENIASEDEDISMHNSVPSSSFDAEQVNMHVPDKAVSEKISESLYKPSDLSEKSVASIIDDEQKLMHVPHEAVTENIAKSIYKPSDHSEKNVASITDDKQKSMHVPYEAVTEKIAEPIYKPSGHFENHIVQIMEDEQMNTHVSQEMTNKITKPLDKSVNSFSEQSKQHRHDIFSTNSDPDSFIQDNEKNWYDMTNSVLHEVSFMAQKLYMYFLNARNESSSDQCVIDIIEDERENNEFCSKASTKLQDDDNVNFVNNFFSPLTTVEDLKFLLTLEVFAILIFIFGHYCLVNRRAENELVSKLNKMERNMFASEKECLIAKSELVDKRKVLDGIADKSFGTDDMIKQLEAEKTELNKQVFALEKELEAAAEAGLELNKMVAELLSSNQNGSDSIISSVQQLQQQLNDQEATSIYINDLLAEKSRENSELKVQLSETNRMFESKIDEMMNVNKKLCKEKEANEAEMKNIIQVYKHDVEVKTNEISQLKEEYETLEEKYDDIFSKWQSSAAQAEAMKDALSQIENAGVDDMISIREIADANAKYLAVERKNEFLKESLTNEKDLRKRLQSQISDMNSDILRLRSIANQNEKEKLEAQTRLDVLSNYFTEKETQLQSEFGYKEALFMKQKGESITTVERVRQLQDEIQGLRSQNEQLRAEIEAQSITHKAQINTVEMRAHDSWLAAKQAERRLDEAKSEASVLRKKLTSLTQNYTGGNSTSDGHTDFIVPSPSSPLINLPPPPLTFLPPPPFLPMEIRPAPLGRLMSPPPPSYRYDELNDTETDFSPPRSPHSDEWDRQTF